MKTAAALLALPLISALASGQSSYFDGLPGLAGDVVLLNPGEIRPAQLQGIQLLALDAVGRTPLTGLLPGAVVRRTDIPGAARLHLPEEAGSLYKYRRGSTYGYFLVGPSGLASPLLELPGTGFFGTTDPLPGRVAVDPRGSGVLVSSSRSAGGDLWEIDLGTGNATNRTDALGPLEVGRNGLVLLDTWGLAATSTGVLRFARLPGATAEAVPLPGSPSWIGPDVVRSADGSTVAFLAGAGPDRALVFVCQSSGTARQVSDQPRFIPGAGFLPEEDSGPFLALSTDGSWAAWRAGGTSGECFARETGLGPRPPEQHLTGPAHFDNTLNDTGVIAFFDPDSVVLVAGRDASAGITRSDLYRLDLSTSGPTVRNLTGTSGIFQPPYDYGQIETRDGLFQVPDPAGAFLVHDDSGSGRLLWVGLNGSSTLLSGVKSLDSVTVAGTHVVVEATRPPGFQDPLRDSLSLVQIPPGGSAPIIVPLPDGCHLTGIVGSRPRSLYAGVLEFQGGGRLGRVPIPSPSGFAIAPTLHSFGPTVGISLDGSVLATVQRGSEWTAFAWSDLGVQLLRTSRVAGFLLPGS